MKYICENCGQPHNGEYGSGRFCMAKCARCFSTKAKRVEINSKVSAKLKGHKPNNAVCKSPDYIKPQVKLCKQCGKTLWVNNQSGYCRKCFRSNPLFIMDEYRDKLRQAQLRLVLNGTHQGWKTRNIKSYAEKFFETVLKNNRIQFSREVHIGKYFLDFVIGNIDLEIDGKQHKYLDRRQHDLERDKYLRDHGYFVYRIAWNSLNTIAGKEMMKEKIDLFLLWYESYINN